MIRRLVIFLIRKKLGVGLRECFTFVNQKSDNGDLYYFTRDALCKLTGKYKFASMSGVSLNWLLDDQCKIIKIKENE